PRARRGRVAFYGAANLSTCLTVKLVRVRVSRSSPVGLRVRRTWRFKEIDLLPLREGTSRNGWQPTADALLTMERLRQPVAVGGNGFGLLWRFSGPGDLRPVATGCNHGAP